MTAAEDQPYPPISDYGLVGDMHSAALVSLAGSIDWLCFPRFDSPSVFGRILDWDRGGYCAVAPHGVRRVTRRYLPATNVLETTFETDGGVAVLTDFMAVAPESEPTDPESVAAPHQLGRILVCTEGTVDVHLECHPRFDYGTILPHVKAFDDHSAFAHGGADAITLFCSAPIEIVDGGFRATAQLSAGERFCVSIGYESRVGHRARDASERVMDEQLADTLAFWERWARDCNYKGEFADEVLRSALTLKALSYAPTGALVAAPTTSLPESIGGHRNWDYRFTWVRDAGFAVYALSLVGLHHEAARFKDWLEWAGAGHPSDLRTMYGLGGERRLTELELPLRGYRDSRPVRIGNAASDQLQLDVYGELLDSAHTYRRLGNAIDEEYWEFLRGAVQYVIDHWREPDQGIWESRGAPQHFVLSKAMCWVAVDRAITAVEEVGLPGDVELWRAVRDEIREDVLTRGYDSERGTFTGTYEGTSLDASVLLLPLFRFISADDPRMRSTIETIARELMTPEGFVYRYQNFDDGVRDPEGAFTVCTFWLCDCLIMLGEAERARALFRRACMATNDLGLLSEQFDPTYGALGNFPQALSHLGLINVAVHLQQALARAERDPN